MQGAGEENPGKSPSDEEYINFTPSRNFKHKKYLRSKFEEAMLVEANSSLLGHNKREKVNHTLVSSAAAQPPLPPNPPPPDTPPMIINLKQEIEDDGYENFPKALLGEVKAAAEKIKTDELEEKPTVTMCRNFARGTCKKGAACIFTHELILSQLPGVYTFCRNFQNSMCSFPKCKFVHATVFEKEHFFRTGYLPPHTLAHLKEASVQQPPPQPSQFEEVPVELPPVYSNVPPPSVPCSSPEVVLYNVETSVERSVPNVFSAVQPAKSATSPKREWCETGEVSSSTRDLDSGEPVLAKKCKNCASKELRYNFASLSCSCSEHGVKEELAMANFKKKAHTNKEQLKNIAHLKEQGQIIDALLNALLKSSPNSSGGVNGLHKNTDKDLYYWLTN